MELVRFAEARDLQTLVELVWLAGAKSASVVGETAARSILSVSKLGQVLLDSNLSCSDEIIFSVTTEQIVCK